MERWEIQKKKKKDNVKQPNNEQRIENIQKEEKEVKPNEIKEYINEIKEDQKPIEKEANKEIPVKKEKINNEKYEKNEPKIIIDGINIFYMMKPRKLKTKLFINKKKLDTVNENVSNENNNIDLKMNDKNKE